MNEVRKQLTTPTQDKKICRGNKRVTFDLSSTMDSEGNRVCEQDVQPRSKKPNVEVDGGTVKSNVGAVHECSAVPRRRAATKTKPEMIPPMTRQEALRRTPAETREVRLERIDCVERHSDALNQQDDLAARAIREPKRNRAGKKQLLTTADSGKRRVSRPTDRTEEALRINTTVKARSSERGEQSDANVRIGRVPPIQGRLAVNERDDDLRRTRSVADTEQRRTREPTLQITNDEIVTAQRESRLVQKLVEAGEYRGKNVDKLHGLVVVKTPSGRRIVLPPALWSTAFKEHHDSVWAGYLRAPHTYARMVQTYWWPSLQREVKRWVLGCQECGSRKARPREVVPPLRSIRGGDVGDRWALDVAGPPPTHDGGERYVIAVVEYVARYAVAAAVKKHEAENVAVFLMRNVVLWFGPFRELLTDGPPELTGKVIEQLVVMLQAEQVNPVPYRPQMIGLVERFRRTWNDMVATNMHDEKQHDWNVWVDFAVYAYNAGRHSTVALTPNELMMGRRLRSPNELLQATSSTEAGELNKYHKRLLRAMESSRLCAEAAREKEQRRQAKYYNTKVRAWRSSVDVQTSTRCKGFEVRSSMDGTFESGRAGWI
ncbi:hypothetical protein PR001_g467 [Phytophthora rubi]|uniref:Integrase catalytic domain-containing protein n=1 Tax=Phytophthora rubi TaxID=129364 RepID=A0A6A3PIF8_9STRA|nr:hypothetical protein PR001_g467 [Phytophthora rubi]